MLPAALRMQNIGRTECGVPTPGEPRRHEDGGKFLPRFRPRKRYETRIKIQVCIPYDLPGKHRVLFF